MRKMSSSQRVSLVTFSNPQSAEEVMRSEVKYSSEDPAIEITWPIAVKEIPKKILTRVKVCLWYFCLFYIHL